ncbi:MAG: TetR/AcrR family transcriptional regulator [Acidimicrobiia bacterium]|nr:TetR/AcrR family transcriptional regulator [Acidimicrobiia bacterium]
MITKTGRAKPLSPEERRTAILDAVIPLLVERGAAVTTAEMAEAAGIAEGTIFRVFEDKNALLHAAIGKTLDPEPILSAFDSIDTTAPLQEQLTAAAGILAARYEKTTALIGMARSMPDHGKPSPEAHRIAHNAMAAVAEALTRLLDPHQDRLTVAPAQAAILLRGLLFANAHQLLHGDEHMSPAQLVDVLLNGIVETG